MAILNEEKAKRTSLKLLKKNFTQKNVLLSENCLDQFLKGDVFISSNLPIVVILFFFFVVILNFNFV